MMSGNRTHIVGLQAVALAVLISACAQAVAQGGADPHAHHRGTASDSGAAPGPVEAVELHDQILITQDGEEVRFAAEVIADYIVVMDFVYTTCTTVCPVLSAVFSQVQDDLGESLDERVRLVSVSVDPGRDTPERLKNYSGQHGARPGWFWLTGEKASVDLVLQGLGAFTPNFEDHPSMVLVGDARSGQWTRFFGFPSPKQILTAVGELTEARQLLAAQN